VRFFGMRRAEVSKIGSYSAQGGVPSLSFTARQRRIQRDLPSTLTNGQKVGRTFQRKTFHGHRAFLGVNSAHPAKITAFSVATSELIV